MRNHGRVFNLNFRYHLTGCLGLFLGTWVLGVLLWMSSAQVLGQDSAPPQLTRLYPPGAQRGQTTTIEIKGKFQAGSVQVWSSVPGLNWQKLEGDDQFQVQIDSQAEVGPIWVRVSDASGASEVLPFVVGHLPEIIEVEPNDHSQAAMVVADTPVVVNGVLQARGDVDHFQVSLRGGQTLVAVVDAERHLKSLVDATLQLVTTNGQILAQNLDYRGLDPQIVWTADSDIDVVVRVFGFPAAPDSTISLGGGEKFLYRLSLTTGPAVEAVTPLAFNPHDTKSYIRHGWNVAVDSAESDFVVSGQETSVKLYWPDAVGLLELPTVSHPSLLARDVRQADSRIDEQTASASALALPLTITGNLSQDRQVDSFLLASPGGKQWRVHVAARELGYAWDPAVEIYQVSDGKRLHRQDDSGSHPDPDWNWTVPAEGVYQLRVFDLHGHSGPHQWYRLCLTEVLPELKLTVDSNSFRGKVGEVVEIPVKVDRRHGFDAELEFALHLDGDSSAEHPLSLETVRSNSADDSGKQVTLKITSSEAFNGPVRLIAGKTAQPDHKSPVVDSTTNLAEIWLTISPQPTSP